MGVGICLFLHAYGILIGMIKAGKTSIAVSFLLAWGILTGCAAWHGDSAYVVRENRHQASGETRHRVLPNGDVVLAGMPAEVQESPRHCAAATLARALAWEGVRIPQANLALYGGVTAERGVGIDEFYEELLPLFADYGLRLRTYFRLDAAAALERGKRHNALASADRLPLLRVPSEDDSGPIALETFFCEANPTCLRLVTRAGRERFSRTVIQTIRAGHPLLWGVVLGVIPEQGVLAPGGHLRLIVGYNEAEQTILYSDPWGPDCPVKTMDIVDAWAITMSLDSLETGLPARQRR